MDRRLARDSTCLSYWSLLQGLPLNQPRDPIPHVIPFNVRVSFTCEMMWLHNINVKLPRGASLAAQWLRVRLPMQGTRVRALVWEDPTCRGATRPVSHNYWACASGASAPQQERPRQWEAHAPRWRVAPACRNERKPSHRNEDPTQPKINK